MTEHKAKDKKAGKLWILAMVNVLIWAVAIVAQVFVLQECPGVRGLYVVLSGGLVIGIILFSGLLKRK